jgi:hypothetical protein
MTGVSAGMHIEILVEEPSAQAALEKIVPKVLGQSASFVIHPHQGKQDLLARLPGRLRGYASWLPQDWRIVVLIDADEADCRDLKARLEREAASAGLITKSRAPSQSRFQVLNRLAVKELEAWFFGDPTALNTAYPRVPVHLHRGRKYRDPDAIVGGTAEALERVLKRHGYHPSGLPKILAARMISAHMDPGRNRSHSFQVFRQGLLELAR